MRYAVILTGVVVNVVMGPPEHSIPGFLLVPSDVANINDTFDGVNFIPPPPPALTPEQQARADAIAAKKARDDSLDGQADFTDLRDRIKTATPAQIDTWITNNVTNLAQARTVLGAIVKYLARNA